MGIFTHLRNTREDRLQDPRFFAEHPEFEYIFVLACVISQLFTQFGANYSLPLLDVLTNFYHSSEAQRTWYMSSFPLTSGTFILITGRIGDVYGLRMTVMGGFIWTALWAILGGVAFYVSDPVFFIICRAMQGVGLAFVLPNVLGAAGRVYKPGTKTKFMVFGFIGVSAPIGGCLGGILGGVIGETTDWNWICWAYAMGTSFTAVLTGVSMPHFERQKADLDAIGCVMAVVGLVLISFAVNQAAVAPSGWGNPYILVLFIVSIIILVVFVWYELHIPQNPLLPSGIIQNSRVMLSCLAAFLSWGSYGVLFYRYFVFMLDIRGNNPVEAGGGLGAAMISGCIAAFTCGYVLRWIPAHLILVASLIMFTVASILLVVMPPHETYYRTAMGIWISEVWGCDLSWTGVAVLMSDLLPYDLQGMAGSLTAAIVNYAQSFLVGFAGTIEARVTHDNPDNLLLVHRACSWFAFALAVMSIVVGVIICIQHYWFDKRRIVADEEKLDEKTSESAVEEEELSPDQATKEIEARRPSKPRQSSFRRASDIWKDYQARYPHELPEEALAPWSRPRPSQIGRPESARPSQIGRPESARPSRIGRPESARPSQVGRPNNIPRDNSTHVDNAIDDDEISDEEAGALYNRDRPNNRKSQRKSSSNRRRSSIWAEYRSRYPHEAPDEALAPWARPAQEPVKEVSEGSASDGTSGRKE